MMIKWSKRSLSTYGITFLMSAVFCVVFLVCNQNFAAQTIADYVVSQGDHDLAIRLTSPDQFPEDRSAIRAERKLIEHRLQYKQLTEAAITAAKTNDPAAVKLQAQARDQFAALVQQYHAIINQFTDNPRCPIWQTDFAELLLIEQLQVLHQFAAEAYTFGQPTPQQSQAFQVAAIEALQLTTRAKQRLFELQTILPRAANAPQLQRSGLIQRLFDEYDHKRTPFFQALAALYVTAIPRTESYYTAPTEYKLLGRKMQPDNERMRLLNLVLQNTERFITDRGDEAGIRFASMVLASRALLQMGNNTAAIKLLNPVLSARHSDLLNLTANLTQARIMIESGEFAAAITLLDQLKQHPLAKSNLTFRIMLTDMHYRVLAVDPSADIFSPYFKLLEDDQLSEAQKEQVRYYIALRWDTLLAKQDAIDKLPPRVRLMMTDFALQKVQTPDDSSTDAETKQQLQRVIMLAESLTSPTIPEDIRAHALYNKTVAFYQSKPPSPKHLLEVSKQLTSLAQQYPDHGDASRAINFSIAQLQQLFEENPALPGIREQFIQTTEVLFNFFPISEAADNQRVFYAYHVLQPAGQYDEAIKQYDRVPFDHPQYFDAQREALFCLDTEIADDTIGNAKYLRIRADIDRRADRVKREAARELEKNNLDSFRRKAVRYALAAATIVRASVALRSEEYSYAIKLLGNFESDFIDLDDLLPNAFQIRSTALIASAQHDQAIRVAQDYMKNDPQRAAPVLDKLLLQFGREMDDIAEQAIAKSIPTALRHRATAAVQIADVLIDYAKENRLSSSYMLSCAIIRAKAQQLLGNYDQAAADLQALESSFPDNLDLIQTLAELQFNQNTDGSLRAAAKHYARIITSIPEPPYPTHYWHAWLRQLQISDKLNYKTDDIPLHIRQLRLRDSKLGGLKFETQFIELERKHEQS
ncbi:hypothetical protein [Poriferisphaera sp. WC338]|uniref:hypothetical protein n=1 Tax=Poriferisphaera sp. WC338 TaxID=3425129 RepID=UPI003D8131AF